MSPQIFFLVKFFLKKILFERESLSRVGSGKEAEGKADSPSSRETNVGVDPRTLRS